MSHVSIKKPHHKQEISTSCLPASVKMLLNFLGISIEEATLRNLLASNKKGTSAVNVLMLNASIPEIKADVYQSSLTQLQNYLEAQRQPCIVGVETIHLLHWNNRGGLHAIVVHGFDDNCVFVNDPYFDDEEFRIPFQEFLLAWAQTGNVLITIEKR